MKRYIWKRAFNAVARRGNKINLWLRYTSDQDYPSAETVKLTDGEKELAKRIFGKQLHTSVIRKSFTPDIKRKGDITTYAQAFGMRHIKFYGSIPSQNFAATKNKDHLGTFVHELVHVWQAQHYPRFILQRRTLRPRDKGYVYDLKPGARFYDFGLEQQASLVQDYIRSAFNARNGQTRFTPSHAHGTTQPIDILIDVVERQFPKARSLRQEIIAKNLKTPPIF